MTDTSTVPGEAQKYDSYAKRDKLVTEYDLRDNVLDRLGGENGIAHSGDGFRLYADGVWSPVHDLRIKNEVATELEFAALVGVVNPSYNMERNVTDTLKSKTYVDPEEWNNNPDVLVFKNCALDTASMGEMEHDPAHRATVAIPYDYDPEATAPTWEYVIGDRFTEDERLFLQEWFGYCLTTSVKHQITLWLTGPRGGGRSTVVRGIETMLGGTSGLAGSLGLAQLQGNGARFALANIPGKTLLTCTENPTSHMKATETLNALITGDTIQVEQKHKDAYDYRNTAKLMWAMNSLPGL